MYTRRMELSPLRGRRGRSKWIDRQIDEALLAVALQAGFLYAHRRARRVLPKVAVGAVVVTGAAVVTAAAATAAGVGALGVAGGAAAWYRRSKRSAETVPQPVAPGWRPAGVGSNAGNASATESERLTTD
jgi:hypothetical protein